VLARLATRHEGLNAGEVAERHDVYGSNRLPEAGKPSLAFVILRQLANPLTYILLGAGGVSAFLQHWSDVGFIAAVVVIDVVIGAAQEWQAESSAASLRKTLRISPTVVRAGVRATVAIEDLVPGDIVLLESGAAVPADLRLLASHDLRVDESLLTGESTPVNKHAEATLIAAHAGLGDRTNMAHAGTMVVSGRGSGVVCATGSRTELGSIARMLSIKGARPPLLVRMDAFSNRIALATVLLVLLIAGACLRAARRSRTCSCSRLRWLSPRSRKACRWRLRLPCRLRRRGWANATSLSAGFPPWKPWDRVRSLPLTRRELSRPTVSR